MAAAADIETLTGLGKLGQHCACSEKRGQGNEGLIQPEDVRQQLQAGACTKGHGAAGRRTQEDYQQLVRAHKEPVHRKG